MASFLKCVKIKMHLKRSFKKEGVGYEVRCLDTVRRLEG